MSESPTKPRPIVILGPTAGGKSELAVTLAERLASTDPDPPQIISADSMQIYRHMDAGTAKPTPRQRGRAVHHLIDIVEPTERFTVADWLDRTDRLILDLQAQRVRPIIVGGTNLYIKALLEGLFDGPPIDETLRAEYAERTVESLHQQLTDVDTDAAARIAVNDRKRIVRALEVFHTTGKPISAWQDQWSDDADRPYRHDPILIGLHWPAERINPRINLRVKAMFYPEKVDATLAAEVCINGESLPEETARLERDSLLGAQARQAIGYKQVLDCLADRTGETKIEDAFEQTKIQTRRFAKQQRTWLKRFRDVHWLDAADASNDALTANAIDAINTSESTPPTDERP